MSNQEVPTPREFLDAVEKRFGKLGWDLAATPENSVTGPRRCFTLLEDSLSDLCNWDSRPLGITWLNPPFAKIRPWVEKASKIRGIWGQGPLVLLPAAVCTDWFNTYVRNYAKVYELFPRVFKTEIRDCILCDYRDNPGRELWVWK